MFVTHPKIATLVPEWAPFAGWSLILRGEGGGKGGPFAPDPATAGVLEDLAALLADLGPDRLLREMLLCLLPPETWHVTFADLIHQGQLDRVEGPARALLQPAIAAPATAVPPLLARLGLAAPPQPPAPLRLRITGLTRLGGSVAALALEPEPGDPRPGDPWPALLDWRVGVLDRLAAETGLPQPAFRPHLTLGYFANPALVTGDNPLLAELSEAIARRLAGRVLNWQAVGLYRFASMADFRRAGGQEA